MLPDGTYDPQDPKAVAAWMQQVDERLSHLHECIETRDAERKTEVDHYHQENISANDRLLAAIDELKAEVAASATWISDEEAQRNDNALIEQGVKRERERWLRWFHTAEGIWQKAVDWGIKGLAGALGLYIAHQLGAEIPW